MVGLAPFVGREAERRAIADVLAAAPTSGGAVVLLTGPAGIGKTRLAEEAAAGAAAFTVVWASCGPPGGVPPFWPWAQVLGDLLRGDADLRRRASAEWPAAAALVEARTGRPSLDHAQARADLFQDVVALAAAAAGRRPLLLVLDDLHDADASSWQLLAHLAPRLRSLPIVVLATWRTGGARPGDPQAAGLLRQARVLAVPPLDRDELGTILDQVARTTVAPAVAAAVHRRTSGNPLLAQEIVAELALRGGLHDAGTVAAAIPETTRVLVGDRLARLDSDTRTVLAAGAAFGTEASLEALSEGLGRDSIDVLEALEPARSAGVLAVLEPDRAAFSHELVRDVVFELETAASRARLHRQAGDALLRLRERGRPVEPADLARHLLAAGPPAAEEAMHWAGEAGRRAMALLAYEDAAGWLAAAAGAATDPATRAGLLLALGEAEEASGNRGAARQAYLDAAGAARTTGRADLLAAAAMGMSGTVGFEVTLLDQQQIDLLREALDALGPEEQALRASVMARLAVAVSILEDADQRLALTEKALVLARASGDAPALVQALAARCDAIAGPEHVDVRAGLAAEIVDLGIQLHDPRIELLGRRLAVVALLEKGDMAGTDRQIQAFASTAAALRRPVYSWYVPLWRAMRATMEGRIDDARSALEEAERIGSESDSENAVMLTVTLRWYLASELGDTEVVAGMLATSGMAEFPGVWPLVARALCEAQIGHLRAAGALLDTAAAQLPGAERDSEWLPMMFQVSDAVRLLGGHPVARWAYDALLPFRSIFAVEGIGAAIRGSTEQALGVLAAALGRPEDAAGHFDAAVAAAEGVGANMLVARGLREAAIALDDPVRLDAARRRYEALGIESGLPVGDAGTPAEAGGGNVFRREGDVWLLIHAGRQARVRDSKGLRDLARLLAEPARPFPAVELVGVTGGRRDRSERLHEQGDLGELVDAKARDAYRRRLVELDEEIDDADRAADIGRSARLVEEKDALVAQLTAAYGLGRRPRRAGDPAERARQTVTARVREAIGRIEDVHPDLGRHLRRSVKTGRLCVYEPDTPIAWSL